MRPAWRARSWRRSPKGVAAFTAAGCATARQANFPTHLNDYRLAWSPYHSGHRCALAQCLCVHQESAARAGCHHMTLHMSVTQGGPGGRPPVRRRARRQPARPQQQFRRVRLPLREHEQPGGAPRPAFRWAAAFVLREDRQLDPVRSGQYINLQVPMIPSIPLAWQDPSPARAWHATGRRKVLAAEHHPQIQESHQCTRQSSDCCCLTAAVRALLAQLQACAALVESAIFALQSTTRSIRRSTAAAAGRRGAAWRRSPRCCCCWASCCCCGSGAGRRRPRHQWLAGQLSGGRRRWRRSPRRQLRQVGGVCPILQMCRRR